jgi:GrpB-like predicted nucleotidyltransferase (UPF0157 family)
MLTTFQQRYLTQLSRDERVRVQSFQPDSLLFVHELTNSIKRELPHLDVRHIGATALGVDGKGDIDLVLLGSRENHWYDKGVLEFMFGAPWRRVRHNTHWHLTYRDFSLDLHLTHATSPIARMMLDTHKRLQHDTHLRNEYARLNRASASMYAHDYHRRKYEWFNSLDDRTSLT